MIDYYQVAQNSKASQDKTELEELLRTVGEIQPKVILEIGVHLGRSMKVWDEAFRPEWMVGIERDTCYDYSEVPGKVITGVDSGHEFTKLGIEQMLEGKKIDFLFLDGDHLYNAVKRDFELYSPLVRQGGVVAFHDARITDNDTVEVYKFWNEIKHQYKYKEIFSPTGTGVGVLWM